MKFGNLKSVFIGKEACFLGLYSCFIWSIFCHLEFGRRWTFRRFITFIDVLHGLFFSFAWLYLEKGSKSWQKNWGMHIDYLEDDFTGRLHKTIMG